MGAAIEVFDGARVIVVPRDRFIPVKTTNELALLRSDAVTWDPRPSHPLRPRQPAPVVTLGPAYKRVGEFEARMPHSLGLRSADSLTVLGDWHFGRDVVVVGDVELDADGGTISDGTTLS